MIMVITTAAAAAATTTITPIKKVQGASQGSA
jgi:hypothetical protein